MDCLAICSFYFVMIPLLIPKPNIKPILLTKANTNSLGDLPDSKHQIKELKTKKELIGIFFPKIQTNNSLHRQSLIQILNTKTRFILDLLPHFYLIFESKNLHKSLYET